MSQMPSPLDLSFSGKASKVLNSGHDSMRGEAETQNSHELKDRICSSNDILQ